MDAPPIPRLVDLVHAFNGVVVEQFKRRVEKLLSDSIPLWRLLKLLFKILQLLGQMKQDLRLPPAYFPPSNFYKDAFWKGKSVLSDTCSFFSANFRFFSNYKMFPLLSANKLILFAKKTILKNYIILQ